MSEYPFLFWGGFFPTSPLISLIFMTSHFSIYFFLKKNQKIKEGVNIRGTK